MDGKVDKIVLYEYGCTYLSTTSCVLLICFVNNTDWPKIPVRRCLKYSDMLKGKLAFGALVSGEPEIVKYSSLTGAISTDIHCFS